MTLHSLHCVAQTQELELHDAMPTDSHRPSKLGNPNSPACDSALRVVDSVRAALLRVSLRLDWYFAATDGARSRKSEARERRERHERGGMARQDPLSRPRGFHPRSSQREHRIWPAQHRRVMADVGDGCLLLSVRIHTAWNPASSAGVPPWKRPTTATWSDAAASTLDRDGWLGRRSRGKAGGGKEASWFMKAGKPRPPILRPRIRTHRYIRSTVPTSYVFGPRCLPRANRPRQQEQGLD